jgi:hypothetical protein
MVGHDWPWSPVACNRHRSVERRISDPKPQGVLLMLDVIMLALGLAFFALSIGYAYACEWL